MKRTAIQIRHKIRFPAMEYTLMPFKLPMIQYSMEASSRSGSAVSFRQING